VGLRINTNLASIAAQRQLVQSQRKVESKIKQLASGSRFSDPTVGAGDFAIAERLRGQINGTRSAQMNADNAISFVQIAEGGLNEQNNILIRMRELSVQGASDTFDDKEREMLDMEFQQLRSEVDRIAQTTQFGSHKLLSGDSKSFEFQVGAYKGEENVIKYESNTNTTASGLGVSSLSVDDRNEALDSLESIDEALTALAEARSNFGAIQSRLQSVVSNAAVQHENLQAAHSRIADTDFAEATSEMFKQQVLQQFQVAVLAQANQFPLNVLKLLA
jgi:flagellin